MTEREKLELTREEAIAILDGDNLDFEVMKDEMFDNGRWSITYELVVQRISDGKFFRDYYSVGATECQDESPWEDENPNFLEVFPVEKTIIEYE